ncbi:conserved hypothetical protein [Gluconacetobacter diazotrophicus PA1 5]|uniref:ATP-grasp domain-containing protein n=1 Tax=Gluconacetobacter diazotrophicus TaxID=33996 RepID=A0A7W4FE75_GLUDI|nr:hypothetical protein [Gluconacetobacter diazotrophicus]ACI53151.1 conserved hypothetical protein [Gluconacetobacter diazotrophicus PA1 5]MBB2156099.1 hypothetical protein [Gluconacetobacter diazotrophicus]TWB10476.1 glutathione synthase/RimK-type ligase-like ATP-grasp enzyme [Gluconacetobacter diazotrophicus]
MSLLDTSPGAAGALVLSDSEEQGAAPPLLGLAELFRTALQEVDIARHVPGLIARAEREADAYALLDLALIHQLRFQKESGLAILDEALKLRQVFRIASGGDQALHLLVIKTPGDLTANTPLECILENAGMTIDVLYVGPGLAWPARLPPHDVVFVAIGEADSHRATLAQLAVYLKDWQRPVLNRPQNIPHLSRAEAFDVLHDVPGLCMTPTYRIDRAALEQLATGAVSRPHQWGDLRFPIIVRPQGAHGGIQLSRIEASEDIAVYLRQADAEQFFVSNFIDYASADGLFRKFRVVLIDGHPFLAHMGISEHWVVHYPYKEMKADPARRAEEASRMARFDDDFAVRHGRAMAAIHERIGLDYVGFDCAETRDGDLLVFELSNALVIHAADDPALFPYKIPQMQKIFHAFRDMLSAKARRNGEHTDAAGL